MAGRREGVTDRRVLMTVASQVSGPRLTSGFGNLYFDESPRNIEVLLKSVEEAHGS